MNCLYVQNCLSASEESVCGFCADKNSCLFEESASQPTAYFPESPERAQRVIELLSAADLILLDTSFCLFSHEDEFGFGAFLVRYASQLLARKVKFTLINPVVVELAKMCGDPRLNERARAAFRYFSHPVLSDLFVWETGERSFMHADRAILQIIARSYMTRNCVVLTQDKDLIADVYNMTGTSRRETFTHALSLNQFAMLIRSRAYRLDLSPLVQLPPCELASSRRVETLCPLSCAGLPAYTFSAPLRGKDEYFHEAVGKGIVYFSRAALEGLAGPGGQAFLRELEKGENLNLYIVETSLTEELRKALAPWLKLFTILPAAQQGMPESDALLVAMRYENFRTCDEGKRHLLLVCGGDARLYANILSRSPRSVKPKTLWAVALAADGSGSLLQAVPACPYRATADALAA